MVNRDTRVSAHRSCSDATLDIHRVAQGRSASGRDVGGNYVRLGSLDADLLIFSSINTQLANDRKY